MQIEFTTSKGTFLAVKVKENSFGHHLCEINEIEYFNHETNGHIISQVKIVYDKPEIIGIWTSEFTEGMANMVVEEYTKIIINKVETWKLERPMYKNYISKGSLDDWLLKTALESFESLMKANEIWTENPYKEPVELEFHIKNGKCFAEGIHAYNYCLKQWQQAQERTSTNWLILKIDK